MEHNYRCHSWQLYQLQRSKHCGDDDDTGYGEDDDDYESGDDDDDVNIIPIIPFEREKQSKTLFFLQKSNLRILYFRLHFIKYHTFFFGSETKMFQFFNR